MTDMTDMTDRSQTDAPPLPPTGGRAAYAGFVISILSILACGFLSLPGLAVSLMGLRQGPRRLALAGATISILTGIGWGVALISVQRALDALSAQSLDQALWAQVVHGAAIAAEELAAGRDSGELADVAWQGPAGAVVVVSSRWRQDEGGVAVEAWAAGPGGLVEAAAWRDPEGRLLVDLAGFESWLLAPFTAPPPRSAGDLIGAWMRPLLGVYLSEIAEVQRVALELRSSGDEALPPDGEVAAALSARPLPRIEIEIEEHPCAIEVLERSYRRDGEEGFEVSIALSIEGHPGAEDPRIPPLRFTAEGRVVLPSAWAGVRPR
jgi:hypothetical protein